MSDQDVNAKYEALAAEFFRETGIMAPGKDVPASMGMMEPRERFEQWWDWLEKRGIRP